MIRAERSSCETAAERSISGKPDAARRKEAREEDQRGTEVGSGRTGRKEDEGGMV